jgi:hypothetical protein
MTGKVLALALLAAAGFAGWWFRYEPVESPVPAVRIVWDRIGHRHCYQQLIPPASARVNFEQAWEAKGPGWTLSELRCD